MGINYAKLDPALIAALEEAGHAEHSPLPVFVQFAAAPSNAEAEALSRLGVGVSGTSKTITATIPAHSIGELSEQPCVAFVQLAQPLKLLTRKHSEGL